VGGSAQKAFSALLSAALALVLVAPGARAAESEANRGQIHYSAEKTYYETRDRTVQLLGRAAVHQGGESIFADKIVFERDTKLVHATGNVVYVGKAALVQGAEMHFNLETRTGTIIGGRVSTDQFTLSGERINKLGVGRFQAHRAEYSTCKDCPQSWTLSAGDVDLELEGYAYLSNVTAKVMDAPGFWIPYLIVPIKTKRQTGLLIPQFGFTDEGFTFVQPFFWAINRSSDMTFGLGTFGGRGRRLEWEGRYVLNRGRGTANFFHLSDRKFRDYLRDKGFTNDITGYSSSRWGLHVEQAQSLPFDIEQKLRIVDVSDSLYLAQVMGDVPGYGEAYLTSDFSLSHSTDKVSSFLSARRSRNLITPLTEDPRPFDSRTVQAFPLAEVTTNDQVFLDGAVVGGISLGATNFTRSANFYDEDLGPNATAPSGAGFQPGQDPIREAVRARVNPSLYTTLRPWDTFQIVPRLNYKHYFYDFKGKAGGLSRGYLRFDTDLSTQFERIYEGDPAGDTPKTKHLFRPLLNYSVIPYRSLPKHEFTEQIAYAQRNSITGYNFDNEDIVPLDSTLNNANYFAPQGNALSYGFTTQLIRKRRTVITEGVPPTYSYDQPLELSAGQSFNFRELRKDDDQRPLSRFFSLLNASFDKFSGYADYYYIPYQPISDSTSRHVISTGAKWTMARAGTRVLAYERSLGLNYYFNRSSGQSQTETLRVSTIFSINDYIMPGVSLAYNMLAKRWMEANTTLTFQSPSECWKLDMGYFQSLGPINKEHPNGWYNSFRVNLSLNLTGSGFGSFSDPKSLAAGTPAGNAVSTQQ
jgi:LPS-assembly protein